MRNTINILIIPLFACIISSCGVPMSRGYQVPKRAISLDTANSRYSTHVTSTRFNYTDPGNDNYFRKVYDSNQGTPQQKVVRNQIAKEMTALVDENHTIYHESLRRNMTGSNIISDFLTMGLTTSAAVSTGIQATRALSAIATGTKGLGASINGHVLQQQTLSVILKAIHLKKEKVYAEMAVNFDKEATQYTLEDVLRDLGRYWESGLLLSGIAQIDSTVSQQTKQVETEQDKAAQKPSEKTTGKADAQKAQATLKAFSEM